MTLSPPELLASHHILEGFDSGEPVLDDWLRRRARANQVSGASRTYVVVRESVVVAYYALSTGSVAATMAPGRFRRNMPDPVPVVVLGRLAVDRGAQGLGIGRALVRDALMRVDQAASLIGIRGLLVHALTPGAGRFYQSVGFDPSPLDPMTLMITLPDLHRSLDEQLP